MNPHERLRLELVEADLRRLESLLAESVIFGDDYLDQVTTHLIYAGGKRLRPILAVAAATMGEREATVQDLLGGVSVELMHLASLYHDDVMDEAEIRRNVDSVNARYGNLIAIVGGDYLMARSAGGARPRDLPALAVIGLGDVTANGLFAYAASRGMVSVASVLGSLYPVATLFWARLLLAERLRRIQSVGVALTLVGVVAIAV